MYDGSILNAVEEQILKQITNEVELDFQNTEIAFAGKSDGELRRAYWLFKIVSRPSWVSVAKHFTNVALSIRLPINGLIKQTIYKQFVGGETAQEADDNTDELAANGIGTILDFSVEGKDQEVSFERSTQEIINTVEIAAAVELVPFCVFKPSGVGSYGLWVKQSAGLDLNAQEDISWKATLKRIESILSKAHAAGTPVLIDAEESWMQDAVDAMVESFMAKFNEEKAIVYHTLQMYRHDRLEHLRRIHARAKEQGWILAVKLVRGAYMEKERDMAEQRGYPSPIQKDKADTDRDFDEALRYCISNLEGISLVCGTHNEASSRLLTELIADAGIAKNDKRIYFAQLYGMSDHITYNLAAAGYNVAKYVPYGPIREVMPYLIRRAEENTSAAGQTGRELSLIMKELKRRRHLGK